MAHGAEGEYQDDGSEPEKPRIDGVLRTLEAVIFCCLSALALFWFSDRLRDLNFEPVQVTPCIGADCTPYLGPQRGSPWSVISDGLDPSGVTSFSYMNMCAMLSDVLQTRGEDADGVGLVVERMTARGIVTIDRSEDGTLIIGPGPRNDSFYDALRDAVWFGAARGCYPINYRPVFWPLWLGWMVLVSLRLLRGKQVEWAKR